MKNNGDSVVVSFLPPSWSVTHGEFLRYDLAALRHPPHFPSPNPPLHQLALPFARSQPRTEIKRQIFELSPSSSPRPIGSRRLRNSYKNMGAAITHAAKILSSCAASL